MNKDEALLTLKNIYALESNRDALSQEEHTSFQAAIKTQSGADAGKVLKIYQGEKAKTSLSNHDKAKLTEAVAALSAKSKTESKKDELAASAD
jgi:hypothetical protein